MDAPDPDWNLYEQERRNGGQLEKHIALEVLCDLSDDATKDKIHDLNKRVELSEALAKHLSDELIQATDKMRKAQLEAYNIWDQLQQQRRRATKAEEELEAERRAFASLRRSTKINEREHSPGCAALLNGLADMMWRAWNDLRRT